MNVLINPKPLTGTIAIPPSKSLSHRAIIAASLCKGKSVINNIVLSDDVLATLEIMEKVGVKISRNPHQLVIHGQGKIAVGDDNFFDCNESGSTLRFLVPVLALSRQKVVFTGKPALFKRPMQVFETLFKEQGFCFQQSEKSIILAGTLSPDTYPIPGNVSSQFISGLMFALPLLNGDSKIAITSPLESAEYVDLTIEMLRHFQIRIEKVEDGFIIPGNQTYRSATIDIESDYSQLAFFAVAGMLSGPITCKRFLPGSLQPDRRIIEIVRGMGGSVTEKKGEYTFSKSKTSGRSIDVSQCPDIAPVLALLGALSDGQTIIDNAQRLRLKETNRIKTTSDSLSALGVPVEVNETAFVVTGVSALNGGVFDSFGDHRIAMTLAVAAIRAKAPVVIKNAEAINKSYPNFFKDYQSLGGDVTIIEE